MTLRFILGFRIRKEPPRPKAQTQEEKTIYMKS